MINLLHVGLWLTVSVIKGPVDGVENNHKWFLVLVALLLVRLSEFSNERNVVFVDEEGERICSGVLLQPKTTTATVNEHTMQGSLQVVSSVNEPRC